MSVSFTVFTITHELIADVFVQCSCKEALVDQLQATYITLGDDASSDLKNLSRTPIVSLVNAVRQIQKDSLKTWQVGPEKKASYPHGRPLFIHIDEICRLFQDKVVLARANPRLLMVTLHPLVPLLSFPSPLIGSPSWPTHASQGAARPSTILGCT